MPVSTPVDLYLAKSVGELNTRAEIPNKNVSPKIYVKTAEKLLADANRCHALQDEEKSYVLYMRYFNIITIIKKHPEYKKQKDYFDKLIGSKNLIHALDKAESLSKSLSNRYDLREAELVSKKLEALDEAREKAEKASKEAEGQETVTKETKELEKGEQPTNGSDCSLFSNGAISARGLYDLIQQSPDDLIVMDTRSSPEFKDSHLRHKSVISVPVEIVKPGTTVPKIETSLPPESRELWQKRAHVDYIVLLDWNSTVDKVGPGKTLQTLKDALYKFDSHTLLRSEPLILEGGYDEWTLYYPAIVTQPVRDRPVYTPVSNIPSLDFDYPDLDAAFKKTPATEVNPANGLPPGHPLDQSESSPGLLETGLQKPRSSIPNIPDRSKKPSLSSSSVNNSQTNSTLNSQNSIDRLSNDHYPSVESKNDSTTTTTTKDLTAQSISVDQTSKSNIVAEQVKELAALQNLQSQKQQELREFQKEKERMALEHKARLEQLKKRQSELETLERMKRQQEKDVADLMRMKRNLEDEMKLEKRKEEAANVEKETEERKRTDELEKMKREEEDRLARLKSVDKSRLERKIKEENERLRQENLRREEEAANKAEAERFRLELQEKERIEAETKQREESAERERKSMESQKEQQESERKAKEAEIKQREESERKGKEAEAKRTEDSERKAKEAEIKRREEVRLQQEREIAEMKRKEEELRIKQEEQRIAAEKAKAEKERMENERKEKERKEREQRDKEKAEEAKRMAEERLKRIAESERRTAVASSSASSMLPVGWERRLDQNTNRYFYINHNDNTTQWQPPQTGPAASPTHGKVYKARLKDESDTPRSGGLVRSHSSPNIAQLVDEEGREDNSTPMINRGDKPRISRPMTSQSHANRMVNIKAARLRDLNPVYGSVGKGLTGLRNLGNTCYMNSTLQCLNNCFPLVSYFLTDTYVEDLNRESSFSYNGEVVDEFAVVMKALWLGQYRSISPRDFKAVICRYNDMFDTTMHQDSQELLAFLLDGLHEGLNRIKVRPKIAELDTDNLPDPVAAEKSWANHKLHNESIIVELFQGVLKSTLTCLTCGKKATRFDPFQYLTLSLPTSSSTLQDCLRVFLREEKLTGNSQWRCPRCKTDRDATKKLDIWKLPHVLIIHLKRFRPDGVGGWHSKNSCYVDFPVTAVDLDNIVTGPRRHKPYSLYAVSNHYGSMDLGHYTAYAKNPCSGEWHKFDDTEVRSMSRNDVKSPAAYFLFYTCLQDQK